MLHETPTLMRIDYAQDESFLVFGDTHGQFYDLLNIFNMVGLPNSSRPILFNGDFVDRGSFSCEVCRIEDMFLYSGNVDSNHRKVGCSEWALPNER